METKERRFRFSYSLVLKSLPAGAKRVDIWIPVPVSDGEQEIGELAFDAPISPDLGVEKANGIKIAHWRLEQTAPAPFSAKMTFSCKRRETKVDRWEKARGLTEEERQALKTALSATRLECLGGPVEEVAATIKAKAEPREMGKAAYDYVLANMTYVGNPKSHGSTVWACDTKTGNCTDFHALFASIMRTAGVPAKVEFGCRIPANADKGVVKWYHCWVKFYVGGIGWVHADISDAWKDPPKREYYFGNLPTDRLLFSCGRDIVLVPPQAGEPLNWFVYPYAEADGKSIPVEREFSFEELP